MATKIEKAQRELMISRLLMRGAVPNEICRIMAKEYHISRRTIDRHLAKIYKVWSKNFEKELCSGLSYHKAIRMEIYQKAYVKRDYKTCLAIMQDIAKLEGLYVEEDNKGDTVFNIRVDMPEEDKEIEDGNKRQSKESEKHN